jgi:carboxypeptidase C (cathepsin A)
MTNTESASVSPQSPHNSHASATAAEPAASGAAHKAGDQPFFDPVVYGNGPDDSVTAVDETAALTHHSVTIGGHKINYTATAGHLVIVDPSSSQPAARMFYVAFTQDNQKEETRPLTFFYNGGPGSSAVFVLLGSFAPRRIKTSMPGFTPPAPY